MSCSAQSWSTPARRKVGRLTFAKSMQRQPIVSFVFRSTHPRRPHSYPRDAPQVFFLTPADPQFPPYGAKLRFCALTCRRLRDVAVPLMYKEPMQAIFSGKFVPSWSTDSSPALLLRTLQEKPSYHDFIRHLRLGFERPENYFRIPKVVSLCSRLTSLGVPVQVFNVQLATQLSSESSRLKYFGLFVAPGGQQSNDRLLAGLNSSVRFSITQLAFDNVNTSGLKLLQLLLPKCQSLQMLEFVNCHIAQEDLFSISDDARITDLILNDCWPSTSDPNTSSVLADFKEVERLITEHPALKDSLQHFNIICESPTNINSDPLRSDFIEKLPPTLRYFHWNRCDMSRELIPSLQKLATQVEYLSLQAGLTGTEVEEIVLGSWYDVTKSHVDLQRLQDPADEQSRKSSGSDESEFSLGGIANAVAALRLQQRFAALGLKKGTVTPRPTLKRLDLRQMTIRPAALKKSLLLGPQSLPLEIIEVEMIEYDGYANIEDLRRFLLKVGWKLRDCEEGTNCRTFLERMI